MREKIIRTTPLIIFILIILYPVYTYFFLNDLFLWLAAPFLLYFLYRSITFAIGVSTGFLRYRKEKATDWQFKLEQLVEEAKTKLPKHLIVIPVNKENFEMIERCIDSILSQNYNTDSIHISVTIEKREDFEELEKRLITSFKDKLGDRLMISEHTVISGEAKGAASNRTFGAKSYVDYLEEQKISTDDVILTSPDVDTVFSRDYLARVSYEWISDNYSKNHFYQTAVYKFDNNFWDVPISVRVLSSGLTLSVLSSSTIDGANRFTFSCFSTPLTSLIEADFWDTKLSIDDTPFHWRAYEARSGEWRCKVFYTPISVDAITSKNYLETHIRQYQQYHRWGWGIIAFLLAVKAIARTKTKRSEKLYRSWKILDTFFLKKVLPVVISIYLLLISVSEINEEIISAISTATNINLLILVVVVLVKLLLIAEQKVKSLVRVAVDIVAGIPLGFIVLLTYGFVPYVQAAFELAIGFEQQGRIKWSEKTVNNE